ncbi:MAG: adenylosuccinate lyase [Bacteroidetes bacterium]|jgi:adenylosuccinate lyase|nr:adenylosuccinate lyase [Bacteroidota bacterium]MBT6686716.1 adenylosuccinate lyase [Bacteroidota bacterium]MBT7143240.1 adenylosuccinate lyase [Bacteroidota bacterium]MBT7492879.1 adenylosuccinate lyase [Bacteroidota bacterium]
MFLQELSAISPVDGRYRTKTTELAKYFSEFGLIKYRVLVELEYFISLCKIPLPQLKSIEEKHIVKIRSIYSEFSIDDAQQIKEIEKTTNHDIKAVEYFIKEKFFSIGLQAYIEFVHFGLTSQDINNTATPLSLKHGINEVYLPIFNNLHKVLERLAEQWTDIPMLARTHGQPASPTRLGKEILVFAERLDIQLNQLRNQTYPAKFGGATGNFNAHHIAFPEIDWKNFANKFVTEKLELQRSQTTTQIEHYDNLASIFDNLKRINTILLDLNRDFWAYISMNYFLQKIEKSEVGSSAMPHKVNPIDFENSEGNLGIANALFEHLSAKLPISRLQRDLTDSTVLRNIGVPLSHTLIAIKSLLKGLNKISINKKVISSDLEQNYIVVAEAIQTILRRENFPEPYETLKELTRTNKTINKKTIEEFIDLLNISDSLKTELRNITPYNYTGI